MSKCTCTYTHPKWTFCIVIRLKWGFCDHFIEMRFCDHLPGKGFLWLTHWDGVSVILTGMGFLWQLIGMGDRYYLIGMECLYHLTGMGCHHLIRMGFLWSSHWNGISVIISLRWSCVNDHLIEMGFLWSSYWEGVSVSPIVPQFTSFNCASCLCFWRQVFSM